VGSIPITRSPSQNATPAGKPGKITHPMAASWIADAQLSMKHQGSGQWTDEQLFARFREFMRKLTGSPGLMNWRFYAYSWQVHGVFITLEKGSTTVRVYHFPTGAAKDCTAGDHGGETCDWKLLLPEDAPPTI